MKPDYRFLIVVGSLFAQLVSSSAAADASAAEALHAAYVTRLFALETRLAVLTSGEQLTSEEKTSLALLKTERERLCRRVKVSKQYVRKRPFDSRNRMEGQRINPIIAAKALLYGVNPDFVHAIITCESNYDAQALSRAGAMGLMQLMPETADDLGVENPWSPEENIDGGIRYILALLEEFRDPWKALVSYNCGPEILRRASRFQQKADVMPARFFGCLPEDVRRMTDRPMSFVEPYLTAELGEKVGTKRDNQGIKTLL